MTITTMPTISHTMTTITMTTVTAGSHSQIRLPNTYHNYPSTRVSIHYINTHFMTLMYICSHMYMPVVTIYRITQLYK